MVGVISKSKNIQLFWDTLHEMGRCRLVNHKSFLITLRTLAKARALNKCIDFFHAMNGFGFGYDLRNLNVVVEDLCGLKLVIEVRFLVLKLKELICANGCVEERMEGEGRERD
ncbi:hypothetical protein ACFX2J_020629 [Malus domestica]